MPEWKPEESYCDGCHELIEDWEDTEHREIRGRHYIFCSYDCAEETLIAWRDEERAMDYDDQDYYNTCDFRDPGGGSALRNGPLVHPCPNCGEPNRLTPADVALGYQCDECADRAERGW